jgi:iron complex transport system substrate-binding protein
MTRLRFPALLTLLLLSLVAAACGDDDAGPAASSTTSSEAAAAFPVTIEHKYGTTELDEAPERIVTVGYNEQDALWALGVAPVGVTDWMSFENGIGPWAEEAAAAAGPKPELLKDTDGIAFEKIAALRPDVIVALYTSLTKADYDKLVQIAPVVAPPKGTPDWGIEWQETVEILGEVTGRQAEAEKVVADVEANVAQAKADHPEFAGKTASMAMALDGMWAYGKDDPRSKLLESLGFELSPELVAAVGGEFSSKISGEKADLFDLDTVVWLGGQKDLDALTESGVYAGLPVHEEKRDVFIAMERPDKAMNAIGFQSPLSIQESLDVLVPALAKATAS